MTPANKNLFNVDNSEKLDKTRAQQFHTTVAKELFISKRARPDIQPTIAILATRVQKPNKQDWEKLVQLMKYLNGTRKYHLTLSIDKWKL